MGALAAPAGGQRVLADPGGCEGAALTVRGGEAEPTNWPVLCGIRPGAGDKAEPLPTWAGASAEPPKSLPLRATGEGAGAGAEPQNLPIALEARRTRGGDRAPPPAS